MGESVTGEHRMLIDGELVDAASGARYDNINPATEEVIGQVADASAGGHGAGDRRGPAGVRRDRLGDDPELRKRCLRQLHEALAKERETLRPQIVAEVGAPIMLTYAVQMDTCIDDMEWDIECIDRIEWEYDLPVHEFFGMTQRPPRRCASRSASSARSRRGTSRSCSTSRRSSPRSPPGNTVDPEARAGHAVERDAHRPARGRVHRHPARRAQRRHVG